MELQHGLAKSYFSTSNLENGLFFEWKIHHISKLKCDTPILSPKFSLQTSKEGENQRLYLQLELNVSHSELQLKLCNRALFENGIRFAISVYDNEKKMKRFHTNIGFVDNFLRIDKWDLIPNLRLTSKLIHDFLCIACSIQFTWKQDVPAPQFSTLNANISNDNQQCTSTQVHTTSGPAEDHTSDQVHLTKHDKSLEVTNSSEEMKKSSQMENSPDLLSLKQLSLDLKNIFNQDLNTDITIRVGEKTIKAHKTILCARSPVLCRMFQHSSLETEKNEIVVTDISYPVMHKLVNYMYCGEKPILNYEDACELYYAADKYEILNLREACACDLLSLIEVGNACSMLSLANCHGDDAFKNKTMQFITKNFKAVVTTDAWIELTEKDTKLAAFLNRHVALLIAN